eukprot:1638302-Rhodomonas_salina.1
MGPVHVPLIKSPACYLEGVAFAPEIKHKKPEFQYSLYQKCASAHSAFCDAFRAFRFCDAFRAFRSGSTVPAASVPDAARIGTLASKRRPGSTIRYVSTDQRCTIRDVSTDPYATPVPLISLECYTIRDVSTGDGGANRMLPRYAGAMSVPGITCASTMHHVCQYSVGQ